jgi:salicylate hydroxylase
VHSDGIAEDDIRRVSLSDFEGENRIYRILLIDKMPLPTEPLKLDVLIIGCGIAGLTAAVACRLKGFNVKVLESSPEFAHVGAGLLISSNASRILCDFGLRDALDAVAIHMKRVIFLKHDDGTILSEQKYDGAEEKLGAPLWQIHRADLHDVLLGNARELGVEITMGAQVKSFDWDAPSALLEDGNVVKADVILAADGKYPRQLRGAFQASSPILHAQMR